MSKACRPASKSACTGGVSIAPPVLPLPSLEDKRSHSLAPTPTGLQAVNVSRILAQPREAAFWNGKTKMLRTSVGVSRRSKSGPR